MSYGNPGSTLNDELNRLANGGTYPPISDYKDQAGAARAWAEVAGATLGSVTDLVGVLNLIAGLDRNQWLDLGGVCNYLASTSGLSPVAALRQVTSGIPGAPSAPRNAAASALAGGALITWDPPSNPGDAPRTSYTVYCDPPAIGFPLSGLSPDITGISSEGGLNIGTTYTFTVTATNSFGESPQSAPTNPVTPFGVGPDPVTGVTATSGSQEATVSWTPPAYQGSAPINYYTIFATPYISPITVYAPTTSQIVTGLTNGTTYTFTVEATNTYGSSTSSPSNPVTPAGNPIITGGTVTSDSNYWYHTFTGNGTLNVANSPANVEVLVVAGGGAGGWGGTSFSNNAGAGGGGGAGGVRYATLTLPISAHAVTVGAGGTKSLTNQSPLMDGKNSSIYTVVATGGGAGGSRPAYFSRNGGSGGGGTSSGVATGIAGQGNNGGGTAGSGTAVAYTGAGGGGAGAVGYQTWYPSGNPNQPFAGHGGAGAAYVDWSSATGTGSGGYYGGGGGGWAMNGYGTTLGGIGGGGTGANGTNNLPATDPIPNTGGGGGGGWVQVNAAQFATNGASGVVIVRYPK